MTVTTELVRKPHTGDGATKVFAFDFKVLVESHLEVYLDGVIQTSGFTVTGVPGTGNVTFTTAPAVDVQVLLYREVPETQLSDYAQGVAFPAETLEQDLDLAVMRIQQLGEQLGRAIKFPATTNVTDADTPEPSTNAGEFLRFNLAGDGVDSVDAVADNGNFTASGTGAVLRTVDAKLGDTISVKDFGATGDGVTDDLAAIQAAIDAVAAGTCLYFPRGTYLMSDRLYVLKAMMFRGDGFGSILEWDVTAWTDDIGDESGRAALNVHLGAGVPSDLLDYFVCKDMAFDFGGDNTSTWAEGRRGIHGHTVDDFIFSTCKFQGAPGFMLMSSGNPQHSRNVLINCDISDGGGPMVNFTCDEFLMIGCRHYDGGGIEIGAPDNTLIAGNQFVDLLATAIQLACDHFVISGNVFDNIMITDPASAIGGITVQAGGGTAPATQGKIIGNSISTPSAHANRTGILLQRGTATSDNNDIDISNNTINGPHFGIRASSLLDSKISGNMLRGRTGGVGTGISIESNQVQCLRLNISGNDIKDYSAKTSVATTNGPIQLSTAVFTGHAIGWNVQEGELVVGIGPTPFTLAGIFNPDEIWLKDQKFQAFELKIRNNGGTVEHRFTRCGAQVTGGAGNFIDQINAASATYGTTPTGADASTAMATGGKIGSGNTNSFICDTADMEEADNFCVPVISFNDAGTALSVVPAASSRDVNGTTIARLEFHVYNNSTGATFALTAANIGAGNAIGITVFCQLPD